MNTEKQTRNIIEALLIVSENGLSVDDLKSAIPQTDGKDITEGIELLRREYDTPERAFNIAEIAGKYRIVTKPEYLQWINNLYKKETERLSSPALETLAIIAYKQPVTRTEAESIRGVGLGGVLRTLLDKDLVQVRGRKEVIGRPLLYGTTDKFLEIFGLNSLDDLPALRDFSEEDLEYGKPQEPVLVDMAEAKETGEKIGSEGTISEVSEGQSVRESGSIDVAIEAENEEPGEMKEEGRG
ncbi:MAG: SMC-Scp complex subunit ScpB, partial [Candidatus Omnitrophica bacterium]|nr:SMC-Scp complex subunit ScpB [Candidatus Omnitrophota bacterium]